MRRFLGVTLVAKLLAFSERSATPKYPHPFNHVQRLGISVWISIFRLHIASVVENSSAATKRRKNENPKMFSMARNGSIFSLKSTRNRFALILCTILKEEQHISEENPFRNVPTEIIAINTNNGNLCSSSTQPYRARMLPVQ